MELTGVVESLMGVYQRRMVFFLSSMEVAGFGSVGHLFLQYQQGFTAMKIVVSPLSLACHVAIGTGFCTV